MFSGRLFNTDCEEKDFGCGGMRVVVLPALIKAPLRSEFLSACWKFTQYGCCSMSMLNYE